MGMEVLLALKIPVKCISCNVASIAVLFGNFWHSFSLLKPYQQWTAGSFVHRLVFKPHP